MNPLNPNDILSKISELLSKVTSGIVVLPANPSIDAVAAATALYLGLSKLGKSVSLVCATTPQSDLVAANKIQTAFATGGDSLVISIPYTEGAINKVDYSQTGGYFNLIVEPRAGTKLDPKKVQYSFTGGKVDFIVTIDAPNLNALGPIYAENQSEFTGKTIINIDRHLINDMFGVVNYVVKTSSSTSELVYKTLETLRCVIDKDMATNLYAGLAAATNNFTSYSVNADSFEVASKLLKAGAMKKPMQRPVMNMGGYQYQPMPMQPQPYRAMPQQTANPFMNKPPLRTPMPTLTGQENLKPIEDVENEPEINDGNDTPQDWLKPKIFRGRSGLI